MENNPHYLGDDACPILPNKLLVQEAQGKQLGLRKAFRGSASDFGIVDTHVFEVEKAVAD
ncbi:MAG: hypothetical protein CM1200mP41_37200 [Gammaproteobacteria bacterium]|nr:MAG: hypothetical protein CM1200mP41_37200 [Gammaproteobacteria bacterium]